MNVVVREELAAISDFFFTKSLSTNFFVSPLLYRLSVEVDSFRVRSELLKSRLTWFDAIALEKLLSWVFLAERIRESFELESIGFFNTSSIRVRFLKRVVEIR